ncbi:unnamed protein product [Rhizophagus irregularis]|nr:unnamed protein product [Rhizophagus irregularis]
MENYFLPANTKKKQTHDQVNNANKRKNKPNQDDNLARKKQKTASALKPSWLLTYEWLEYRTIEDTTFMICAWCEKAKFINQMAKGITIYKKDLLDRHLKVVALPRQLVDNTNSTRSSYGTYQNHNLGKEMEKSITSIIKQELYQEINDSPFWSIMIDETTSISDEKHLAMVFKHFSHNVPVLSYIGLIELEDCTTDNILTQILEFIQNNGLNLDNLIHFGSDGASTMVEVKSSLDATIATIKTQFISFDDQPPIYGTNLQQFLQNNPFYNNHIPDDFVHFAKALVHSLQARFPCNDLYDSMKILDPKELPLQESALSSYGIEELKLIFEHFGNQKHNQMITNVETLDMHLTILLNAPDNIEEFNWDKAFNQWKNEHVRRVNTNNI